MQPQGETGVFFVNVKKRSVCAVVVFLKNVVEISDRLVVVEAENQIDFVHGGSLSHICRKQGISYAQRYLRKARNAILFDMKGLAEFGIILYFNSIHFTCKKGYPVKL